MTEEEKNGEGAGLTAFNASFNEAIGETPLVVPKETPAVETPAVETPAVETPAVETPAVETPAVETPAVETPAVETPTETDYKVLYEQEKQRTSSWEGRIRAAEEARVAAEAEAKRLKETPPSTESVVDVDDPLIKSFVSEMGDDFIKPLDAYIKRKIDAALKPLSDKLPIVEKQLTTIDESRVKEHYDKITEAHSDVADILKSGELETFVETLPFKEAVKCKEVMRTGSTEAVIKLLSDFKEKTGKTVKPKETVPIVTVPKEEIANATAVKGGSYVVPKGKPDANDFAGAFNEAIAEPK